MASTLPEPCDCLNWCGDDTRVAAGAVQPCARWLQDREDERLARLRREADHQAALLRDELGHANWLSAMRELMAYRLKVTR